MIRRAVVVFLGLFATTGAWAEVRPVDISVHTTEATRIIVATVADITSRAATSTFGDELIYSDLHLDVSETLKGGPATALTVTIEGGNIGEVGVRVSNLPAMRRGDRAIYFLDQSVRGDWIPHARSLGILKFDAAERIDDSDLTLAQAKSLIQSALPGVSPPVTYAYRIIKQYPHDTAAFTQGLELHANALYESTGLLGASTLRQVDLVTGAVLRKVDVPAPHFGEGLTIFQEKIFQLTWLSGVGFIYDLATFAKLAEFTYAGEGWGLTHDAEHLIMSDGTNQIRFLDPTSLQTVRTITVLDSASNPVTRLNELEYINGQIYANIWQTDTIARIDPVSGRVTGWIDLGGLLPSGTSADVLNGIAFDQISGRLWVTGKLWPWLYEIVLDAVTR